MVVFGISAGKINKYMYLSLLVVAQERFIYLTEEKEKWSN